MGSDTTLSFIQREKEKKHLGSSAYKKRKGTGKKRKPSQLQIFNVLSLYLFAEIQLPQFWLRDPAGPQIHSLVKFSQHPISKKKKKVSQFSMKRQR